MSMKKKTPKIEIDRKAKIIEAAIELFIAKGAAFVKLSDVAKKAKVPAPLIHYYYKDIEDLHIDLVLKVLEEGKDYNLREALKHQDDPVTMLREYIRGPLRWGAERPGSLSLWLYFYYMASWSKRLETLHSEIRKVGRDRISLMLFRGIEKGVFHIPEGKTVWDLAYFIQTQITGYLVMYNCETKVRPIEYHYQEIENIVFSELGMKSKNSTQSI